MHNDDDLILRVRLDLSRSLNFGPKVAGAQPQRNVRSPGSQDSVPGSVTKQFGRQPISGAETITS